MYYILSKLHSDVTFVIFLKYQIGKYIQFGIKLDNMFTRKKSKAAGSHFRSTESQFFYYNSVVYFIQGTCDAILWMPY